MASTGPGPEEQGPREDRGVRAHLLRGPGASTAHVSLQPGLPLLPCAGWWGELRHGSAELRGPGSPGPRRSPEMNTGPSPPGGKGVHRGPRLGETRGWGRVRVPALPPGVVPKLYFPEARPGRWIRGLSPPLAPQQEGQTAGHREGGFCADAGRRTSRTAHRVARTPGWCCPAAKPQAARSLSGLGKPSPLAEASLVWPGPVWGLGLDRGLQGPT